MSRARDEFSDLSTLLSSTFDPTPVVQGSFSLVVVEGPGQGVSLTLNGSQPRVLLGHGPACWMRIPDRHVSRRHAAIDVIGERLKIVDMGSTNGTFVDGVAIVEAFLGGGEIVRMGASAIRVDRERSGPSVSVPMTARFGRMVGASTEMRRLYPLCERLAASNVPVIIEGETGTGKEGLAESLHEEGPRASGPFVVFDCTSVPPNLVESELFGHEKGAFTGALATRKGVFELSDGGTLLIDEIGDLDPALQPKLLRAVERSEIRRIGGDRPVGVDVRLLSATRRNLDEEVSAGRFRDDLFHRLAVTRIELPALRQRRGDVSILARYFSRELGGREDILPSSLLRRWEREAWPGNVRQLRNAIARHLAVGDLALAERADDPHESDASRVVDTVMTEGLPFSLARERVLEAFQRTYVERVLTEHGGDVARAAEASGIGRRYFNKLRSRTGR